MDIGRTSASRQPSFVINEAKNIVYHVTELDQYDQYLSKLYHYFEILISYSLCRARVHV